MNQGTIHDCCTTLDKVFCFSSVITRFPVCHRTCRSTRCRPRCLQFLHSASSLLRWCVTCHVSPPLDIRGRLSRCLSSGRCRVEMGPHGYHRPGCPVDRVSPDQFVSTPLEDHVLRPLSRGCWCRHEFSVIVAFMWLCVCYAGVWVGQCVFVCLCLCGWVGGGVYVCTCMRMCAAGMCPCCEAFVVLESYR